MNIWEYRKNWKNILLYFPYEEEEEGETRLLFSAALVITVFSLITAHLLTRNLLWRMIGSEPITKIQSNQEKIYEVLVEQQFLNPEKKDEYKALSDKESAGGGGLTEQKGFHTLTPFREFVFGKPFSLARDPSPAKDNLDKEDKLFEVGIWKADPIAVRVFRPSPEATGQQGQMMKIPYNYRFQQDFQFRWDGSRALTVPTKELAGYHYFKNMLKQIEGAFAPPGGGNFAYRDIAGTVIREGIKPGMTKVLFLLNEDGQVIDVQLVSSQGQAIVDRACLDAIRGQNFGKVPEEIKKRGLIFGINFIFPGIVR